MRTHGSSLLVISAGALAAGAAFAHHSPSAFDTRSEVTVEGTLTKVEWTNPHVYLTIETVGANGQRALQQVESVSIPSAQSMGLRQDVLALGSRVVVRANPNRRGSGFTVLGADITMGDGNTYAIGNAGRSSRPPTATVLATGLASSWAPKQNPQLAPTVMGWPLTDKGRAALGSVLGGQKTITIGCTALPLPMLMQLPQPRTLDVGDERVVMTIDSDGVEAARVIHLDLAAHPANVAPSLLGHSIGRWEGATLVVDTVGFAPHDIGIGFGIPSGVGKHLVERLTLTEDRLQLRYEVTIEDPEYLAAPQTYAALWDHRPELKSAVAACDAQIAERFRQD
jgi:hypothetical protein